MLPLTLFFACTGGDGDTAPVGPTTGDLAIAFEMDGDYINKMDEEPIGAFRGSIYRADDVEGTGPVEGAEALADIDVEVDLTPDGAETGVLTTVSDLPPEWVTILGFLDTDDNADPKAPDPDSKDPVTLPGENEFEVVAGTETTAVVYFGFLYP